MKTRKTNKKYIVILLLIIISAFLLYKHFNSSNELDSEVDTYTTNSGTFSIMLQQEDGSYKSSNEDWTNYYFNSSQSFCTNESGDKLSDSEAKVTVSGTTIKVTGKSQAYCTLYFDLSSSGETTNSEETTLADAILLAENNSDSVSAAISYIKSKETPSFSAISTSDEGLYYATDDYGDSYYFRGAVENNYVYFAGFYWRIIRINGDGSIRIIYDGTVAHENGTSSSDRYVSISEYSTSYDYNAYVGYMYGTANASSYTLEHKNTNNSTIKTVVDNWYKTNVLNKTDGTYSYANYLSDTLFCNDRSIYSGTGYGTYVSTSTIYSAYNRLYTNKLPVLTCTNKDDRFTVSDTTNGNGALTYPVGLITADEVSMAGGVYLTSNTYYYLYTGTSFWTMTPFFLSISAHAFFVSGSKTLGATYVDNESTSVRPVVNLSSSVIITSGDGTSSNPYVVALSS